MAKNLHNSPLFAYLQREMYTKAHLALEAYQQTALTGLLTESDPHPRVEKDGEGKPIIPSREDYSKYFETMAAKYIQDQMKRCEEMWSNLPANDKSKQAEREALANELAAAKEALTARSQAVPALQTIMNHSYQD